MKNESQTATKPFCKLFVTEEYGQVLFLRGYDEHNDKPIIRMMAWAKAMNGMGALKAIYDDDDKADWAFEALGEEQAMKVGKAFNDMGSDS